MLFELLASYVEILILFCFFDLFLIHKYSGWKHTLGKQAAVLAITAGVSVCNSIQLVSYVTLLVSFPVMALLALPLYKNRLIELESPSPAVVTLFYCFFLVLSDLLLTAVLSFLLGAPSVDELVSSPSTARTLFLLLAKGISTLFYLRIRRMVIRNQATPQRVLLTLCDTGAILLAGGFIIVWALSPSEALSNKSGIVAIGVFCVTCAGLRFFYNLHQERLHHEQLKRMRTEQKMLEDELDAYSATNLESAKQIHDFKGHLLAIRGLALGKAPEAVQYVNDLLPGLGQPFQQLFTACKTVNAIINFKRAVAQGQGILTEINVRLPEQPGLELADLTVVLANLLDNAIESCERNRLEKDKIIRVELEQRHNFLALRVQNTVDRNPLSEDALPATSKLDKRRHGYGLVNVRSVVEKYQGDLQWHYEAPFFTVSVLLCL